ncbi:uncharacterized protein BP5553_06165 [Venustampulla echinocandica]|uniref:Glycosyltransferase family 8 protein n=1 Tax=Venustampulla echinocandica TaxID=2656787 RepID=A0A370TMQ4_9HELO|nr:uncharacterized protein BP5553_06165 [Venustampulla echinocandica]RDL36813.1 hypothetical protein BP5553_06165 [Venustampulla echinocandica]
MEDDDAPYYCIPQARCRLCQFELEEGEVVVAGVDDQRVSSEFLFFRNTTFYDDDIFGIKFHMCCRNTCRFRGRQSPCYHSKCHDFRLYTISSKFLATTKYSFRPPTNEEYRRWDRTLRILAERLKASWAKGLPDELCQIIAGFLVRECAVITAQELADQDSTTNSIVDLSHNVYVRYVMIDDIRYIGSLRSSSPSEVKAGERLLLHAQTIGTTLNVYIGEDHLGIRQLQLSSPSNALSRSDLSTPGLWWRKLSEPCGFSKVGIRTDGLKLRDIFNNKEQNATPSARISWPIPAPTATIIDLASLQRPQKEPSGLRMSFFECNAARTSGYSVATNGVITATIHALGPNMDLTFYKGVDSFFGWSMVWIYMPIDQGEYVTEICRRYGFRHTGLDSLGLSFTTNQERTTLFGCYLPPPSSKAEYQFERIHTPPKNRLLMYPSSFRPGEDSKDGELLEKARVLYGAILNPIQVQRRDNPSDDTWVKSYTKLLAFNQTQYDRVLSLDSDATILQTMDELFLLPPCPVAMPRAYWLDQSNRASALSSQLMLVKPSTAEFERITQAINSAGKGQYDREIVNNIYKDTALIIPHRPYNLLTQAFRGVETANYLGNDKEQWNPDKGLKKAKYLHFSDWPVRKKPWREWKEEKLECDDEYTCRSNELWLQFYSDFAKRREEICGDMPEEDR